MVGGPARCTQTIDFSYILRPRGSARRTVINPLRRQNLVVSTLFEAHDKNNEHLCLLGVCGMASVCVCVFSNIFDVGIISKK